ncbi:MAG: hypothetical protein PHS86_08340 [Syntrophaceae bacterium]|nr:hypothetical protein [Syntrophaceae bacterium]
MFDGRIVTIDIFTKKRVAGFLLLIITFPILFSGCDLVPAKPEEAFVLYRERMKNEQIKDAREMLSQESLNLVLRIEKDYLLDQQAEKIAILNTLDPTSVPSPVMIEEKQALLDVRTLKGVNRTVRLIRSDSKGKWKVDLVDELKLLDNFLAARKTLDFMQEQAGEFAATWKAMDSQLGKKALIEPEPQTRDESKDTKKGPASKKPAKPQRKSQPNRDN